jgi:hypothetical protein
LVHFSKSGGTRGTYAKLWTRNNEHILSIEPTEAQIACANAEDMERIKKSAKSAETVVKDRRSMREQANLHATADLEAIEGPQYGAGQF